MRKIRTISDFTCTRSVLYLRVHRTKSVLYRRVHRAYIARTSRVHRTKSVLYLRVHPYYIGFPGFLETTIQLQHQCTLPESCANLVTDVHTGLCCASPMSVVEENTLQVTPSRAVHVV